MNYTIIILPPDKIEIKKEMLCKYQLKIADLCNISTGNVKKIVDSFFNKEKYMRHYENLQLYLRLRLGLKISHHVLEFNHSKWLNPYLEFTT